jgi:hypothetical protein
MSSEELDRIIDMVDRLVEKEAERKRKENFESIVTMTALIAPIALLMGFFYYTRK